MQEESVSRFDVTLEPEDTVIEAQDGAAVEALDRDKIVSSFGITLEPEDAVIEGQEGAFFEAQDEVADIVEAQ